MKNKLGLGLDRVGGTFIPSVVTPATLFSSDDFFWINTARSPVTLDGNGNVELIENLGNFGGDMQQTSASNRPGYGITTLNGKDVIDLDGVSEFLESTLPKGDWSFLHDGTPYTVLSVFKPGNMADPDDYYVLLATSSNNSSVIGSILSYDDRDSLGFNNILRSVVFKGSSANAVVVNNTDNDYFVSNDWHHSELLADPSNSTAADRSIITADDQGEEKNNTQTNSPVTGDPEHTLRLGIAGSAGYFTGQFAEAVIVKGRMITDQELSKWNTYVQSEWGI